MYCVQVEQDLLRSRRVELPVLHQVQASEVGWMKEISLADPWWERWLWNFTPKFLRHYPLKLRLFVMGTTIYGALMKSGVFAGLVNLIAIGLWHRRNGR